MQHEITNEKSLLNNDGSLSEAGWARDLLLHYNKESINAKINNIKEWDYYYIGNENYGIGLSLANMGTNRALSVHFMDFVNNEQFTNVSTTVLENKKSHKMPLTKEDIIKFKSNEALCEYIQKEDKHQIKVDFKDYFKGVNFAVDVTLKIPDTDSMVIAIPFDEDPSLFYYNLKTNCLRADGTFKLGDKEYHFAPEDSFSVIDRGRGVWPKESTWYWGSASGVIDGVDFGFNIGYGFGNTSAATENLIVYDGKAHKLEEVTFHIPEDSYLSPWKFSSSDGRFEMEFIPILDRSSNAPRGIYQSNQHQVFGKFSGKVTLDDGTVLEISEFMGFAEKVINSVL